MTMQAMVDYLENKGFKTVKKYDPMIKKYRFTISKDDHNLSMLFEYPAGDSPSTKDKKQRIFLDMIIIRFDKEFGDTESLYHKSMVAVMKAERRDIVLDIIKNFEHKEKEKEMSNNIEWRVKEVTLDRRFGETPVFEAHVHGTMNGVVVGDLNDISNKLQKKLNEPDDEYALQKKAYQLMINSFYGVPKPSTKLPKIKKVIFNNPATIVIWADETKTVVKAQNDDIFDPEKGLAMAITKKALGNEGNYFEIIKKWTEEYEANSESKKYVKIGELIAEGFARARDGVNNLARSMSAQADLARREAAVTSLTNMLNNKKATKAELKIAMEHAIRTLGGVTPDA